MKYFKAQEFCCKHCGKGGVSPELMEMLDKAREIAGFPFVISSGYRCPDHNKEVGGVANSSHTKGLAADIKCRDSHTRYVMLKALLQAGFARIELAPTWLHVDIDKDKPLEVAFYPA